MRIVQISDTHISHRGGLTTRNLERIADYVNHDLRPDLVVNSGDIAILDPDSGPDRLAALRVHERFEAPVRYVPGNHDVGQPGAAPWLGIGVTSERVARFRADAGTDHWAETVDGWCVVGLNSEIIGSGLGEEAEQWAWLEDVARHAQGQPALLFQHRPLRPLAGTDPSPEHLVSLEPPERDRLLATLAGVDVRAVGSGHLHRYALDSYDGLVAVSAPSTAFIVEAEGHGAGLCQLGVVEYAAAGLDAALAVKYRSTPLLEEGEPWDLPAFKATLAELEAVRAGVA